jgi:hypothetical protein
MWQVRETRNMGFEFLTAVVMKNYIRWDIMQCSPLKSTNVSEVNVSMIFLRHIGRKEI